MLLPAARLFPLLTAAAASVSAAAVGVLGAASKPSMALKRAASGLSMWLTGSATPTMCGCWTPRCVTESSHQVSSSLLLQHPTATAGQQCSTAVWNVLLVEMQCRLSKQQLCVSGVQYGCTCVTAHAAG